MSVATRPTNAASARRRKRRSRAAALFRSAQAGCRASLNRLMAEHDGLVQAAVRRQGLACALTFAELLQAARTGLWHAILGYDPARGWAFASYAWPCIVRQVWDVVKAHPHVAAGEAAAAEPSATSLDPADIWEAACVQDALHELLARMPYRLYRVIVARYGLGLDGQPPAEYEQIGAQLGVCGERARQLQVEALIWLRQPAHAQTLRSLLSLHTRADYVRSAALAQAWRCRQRPASRRQEAAHATGA
jgi:RNA polymerase sigma factor (sigma-70 family)